MARLKPQIVFPIAISAASAVGLAKTLLLAAILAPEDFGRYAAFIGIAVVATVLISFGRIERTTKAWPRAWEAGGFDFLRADYAQAMRVLAGRGLALSAIGLMLAGFGLAGGAFGSITASGIALGSLLIVPGAVLLLTASGLRAAGSMRKLLAFTAARSGLTLLLATPLAWITGWQGALAGELVGQGLVAIWSWATVRRFFSGGAAGDGFAEGAMAVSHGRTLYASNLVGSLVPFGGRGFVALIADAAMAGAYAVAMVFVQVAQMFAGSVAQREGPLVIKLAQRGEIGLLRRLAIPALLMVLLAGGSFAIFMLSLAFPPARAFWDSYALGPIAIGMTAIAMLAAFHLQLSFLLLAFDAERHVLAGSILSALVTYAGFLVAAAYGAGAAGFVAGVALGESLRALYMLGVYRMLRGARDRSAPG